MTKVLPRTAKSLLLYEDLVANGVHLGHLLDEHREHALQPYAHLRHALRLVRARREGRMVFYRLDDEHVKDLLAVALEHLEH